MEANDLNSDIIIFIVLGILFFLLLSSFVVYIIILSRTRRKMFIENEKQMKMDFEKSLLQSQVEIREDLLKYVALEIHDNLGQIASVIKIQLNTFPADLSEDAQLKLKETKEYLQKLIVDMKALSVTLDSNKLAESGFVKMLQREVQKVNNIGVLKVNLINDPQEEIEMDYQKQIFLFRISQEIINNVLKHAHASQLEIHIASAPQLLVLRYKDNGVGFDPQKFLADPANFVKHLGLKNMRERCKLIGADFNMVSAVGKGTKIMIKVPI